MKNLQLLAGCALSIQQEANPARHGPADGDPVQLVRVAQLRGGEPVARRHEAVLRRGVRVEELQVGQVPVGAAGGAELVRRADAAPEAQRGEPGPEVADLTDMQLFKEPGLWREIWASQPPWGLCSGCTRTGHPNAVFKKKRCARISKKKNRLCENLTCFPLKLNFLGGSNKKKLAC